MANDTGDARRRKAPKDRAKPAPAPAPAAPVQAEVEGEGEATGRPSTPMLIAMAAALGIVVGGVPVLIYAVTRDPPAQVDVTAAAPTKQLTDEESLKERAEAGDGQAMVKLGRGLFEGTWGRRDEKEAERWYGLAIETRVPAVVEQANQALEELRRFTKARRFESESEAAEEHEPSKPKSTPTPTSTSSSSSSRTRTPPPPEPVAVAPVENTPEPEPEPVEVAPVEPAPVSTPTPAPPPPPPPVATPPAPAPAPVAADDEPEAPEAPEEEGEAAQGPADDPAKVAALERDLRKRVAAWFKARDPVALTCKECDGKKEVPHDSCDGSSRAACPQCGGASTIQIVETVPGRSVTGVRTVRRKVDCPNCETGDVTCRCEDGKVTCKCAEEHEGVAGGYREVSARKAFWDFISPTARRGKKQDDLFPAVIRGDELADHRGVSVACVDVEVTQVTIDSDRATVVATVVYVGQNGARTEGESRSVWIRERGKFYLLTPADASPERLRN